MGLALCYQTSYHLVVAVRKTKNTSASSQGSRKKDSSSGKMNKPPSPVVLFWLAFAILIFGLFLFNREAINNSIKTMQNEIAASKAPPGTVPLPDPIDQDKQPPPESAPVQQTQRQESSQQAAPLQTAPPATQTVTSPATPQAKTPAEKSPAPAQQPPASSERQQRTAQQPAQTTSRTTAQNTQGQSGQNQQTAQGQQTRQSPQTGQGSEAVRSTQAGQSPEAVQRTAELRERVLYFTHVDKDGSILRVKVNRRLPVSDSPLLDVLQALVVGPSADEKQKGLISLIPPGTRILYATVRGTTAYINFSEDFQYNTYGVEGYAGQLRQIVFTATEFSNVTDVQILVEGRRIDYLGEGIWMGSPLSRDSL